MKKYFLMVLAVLTHFGLTTLSAWAHPGSGIVVDAQGRVYFSEAGDPDAHLSGAIWQIGAEGKLTRWHEGGAHWLTLDAKGSFAQSDLARWFAERRTPWLQRVDTPSAALVQADGQPIVMGGEGGLYYAKGNMEIVRLAPDGRLTPIAPTLEARTLGGITGLAVGPNDSLYVACPSAVLEISTNGTVSTLVHPITVPDCDRDLAPDKPEPYVRGLAVDSHGTVYAAATGCRAVVKITSAGQVSVVLRAETPWSPTGIAVRGEEVYVLEYQHPNSPRREEWIPRVRKFGRDGSIRTLAILPSAQGRPVPAPPR